MSHWLFVVMVFIPCCVGSGLIGWEVCHLTHRQRGIEVERPAVPDHVPDDWLREGADATGR